MAVKGKRTGVSYPVNGWKYEVEERSYAGASEFWAWRVGIHENARKMPRLIAVCLTFEEAKAEAEKAHRRSEAVCLW
jgi:hypothetical protein